ncbi:MAG TPA: energy-coupling factor transporter transmembrane component T [Capillimicrobium sp.]|nr:energy-coupling factor transporter transmembrane component T [Capillimicrobium sp.]
MTYRRRASPLHAARASVACLWCAALAVAALAAEHPAVLAGVLLAALGSAAAAGVGRDVLRFSAFVGLTLALLIAVGNALVSREGLTVIARLGEIPPFGQVDITLEALGYGAILGLRALAVIACCALYFSAVDPDEVLRLFRRFGFRSALTATLATRMVGVLAADGRRLADGQRCRPGPPASRLALVRAVTAGALDRATDVAAALEVRGYGTARRPPHARRPWSRHDVAFLASAIAILALTVAAAAGGLAEVDASGALELTPGAGPWLLAAALLAAALLPFADRRGIVR